MTVSYRGWRVVAGCFAMAVASWGLGFYGTGVYLAHLVNDRHWPIETVSGAITVYFCVSALLIVSTGQRFDRLGPRRAVVCGTVATTLAVILIAHVQAIWQLYAAFLLMAVGWAWTSSAAINAILAPWFDRKRGRALSIALTGASVGGIVVVPMLIFMSRELGSVDGLSATAVLLGSAVVLAAWRWFDRDPASVGQHIDGVAVDLASARPACVPGPACASARQPANPVDPAGAAAGGAPRWPLRQVVRTPGFLSSVAPLSLGLTVQVAVLTHQITMLRPLVGAQGAAAAVGVTTFSAVAGRLVAGMLMDRFSRRAVAAWNFLSQVIGLLLLAVASDAWLVYAACVFYGLAVGNLIAFQGLLVQHEFPRAQFAHVTRLTTGSSQILYAFGPSILGFSRSALGSYVPSLYACAGLCALSAAIIWFGRPGRLPAAV